MTGCTVKLVWQGATPRKTKGDSNGMVTSVNVGTAGASAGAGAGRTTGDPGTASRVNGGGPSAFVEPGEGVKATATQIGDDKPPKESKKGRMRMNRT